jgi:hypothetical protein
MKLEICEARVDYFGMKIVCDGGVILDQDEQDQMSDALKLIDQIFRINSSHLKNAFRFKIYEKDGIQIQQFVSELKIDFKGQFFYSKRAFVKIQQFSHELSKLDIKHYLNRIDIRRNFKANSLNYFLKDLLGGGWIARVGPKSSYRPYFYTKESAKTKTNLSSVFRSDSLSFSSYYKGYTVAKTEEELSKNKRIKAEDRTRLERLVYAYKSEHKSDYSYQRAELRLNNKETCERFTIFLLKRITETTFCKIVLDAVYATYPLKIGKAESKSFNKFFKK